MLRIIDADATVGGTSVPSKMPGHAWSIPAEECQTGAILAKIEGTPCNRCYALDKQKRYGMPTVQGAMYRRLERWREVESAWEAGERLPFWEFVMAMSRLAIRDEHFRCFDAGDLQSELMLSMWARVAYCTPSSSFWLPTQERLMVLRWLSTNECPENLTIRLSAKRIDSAPPSFPTTSSTTDGKRAREGAHLCPAPEQGNECGECRACWDPAVAEVTYRMKG